MRVRAWRLAGAVVLGALAACGGEEELAAQAVDPELSRDAAIASSRSVIDGAASSLAAALESPGGLPVLRQLLHDEGISLDPREPASTFGAALERLLTRSTLESNDGVRAIYAVTPEALCGESAACAGRLARAPLRLVMTSPRSGALDVEVLAGDALAARIGLREDGLDLQLELDASRELFGLIHGSLPEHTAGSLTIRLDRVDGGGHRLAVAIVRTLEIFGTPLSLRLAPAAPALTLDVDAQGTARLALAVGALELGGELRDVLPCDGEGCSTYGAGRLDLSVASLTGEVTMGPAGMEIRGLGLGNGPASLSLDGMPIAVLDVNERNGRTVSAGLRSSAAGVELAVEPVLDAAAQLHLRPLAAAGVDLDPAWTREMSLSLQLAGPPRGALELPAADDGTVARVLAGQLSLREGDGEPLVIEAGQCLARGEADEAAPLFGMVPASCP